MGNSNQLKFRVFLFTVYFLSPISYGDVLLDHDNGPLTGIFGIPDSREGGQLLGPGDRSWNLSLTHASHSVNDLRSTELLFFDGETSRFEIGYRAGIANSLELGFVLPYVQHKAGNLDSFIDTWHDIFGLPEGHRPARQKDLLDFRYIDTSGVLLDLNRRTSGIGDIRVFGGWKLRSSDKHHLALRFGAKFATGESRDWLGSGGIDLSLGIAGDATRLFGLEKLTGFYRLHAIRIGRPDLLSDRYRDWASYVSAGIGLQVSNGIELRLQGASRSALYRSQTGSLGDNATTVTVGGNIRISDHYELSLGVSEDADTETAPDVSFQISLRYRGKRPGVRL